jgi:hypothetical protein
MHVQPWLFSAITLSNLIRGKFDITRPRFVTDDLVVSASPVTSGRIQSDSPRKRDSPADCPVPTGNMRRNVVAPLWDQRPSRYDMSYSVRAKMNEERATGVGQGADYKALAAVANAMMNVKSE